MYRLEDLAALEQNEITSLCQEFMNPGLVQLLKLIHFDRQFVKAKGSVLTSDDGTEYLDLLGSYGAVALGHNYPLIIEALISTLLADPPMMFQAGLNRYAAALASNLAEVAHGKLRNSFFCNSGTEAVEGALKAARAATGRRTLISVENSFHGKTMGALSMTGKAKYQDPFGPLVGDCYSVPFGDIDALERHLSSRNVAGFIVEPVLGEGGVILHPFKDHEKIETSYLWQAQHLCNKYGTMFILDEIQTGFGRTGTLFAAERFGLEPDIMCLAKALGGALMPIGVTMTTPKVWDKAFGGTEKCLLHT
ncbi:MAG: aminotransferase class III-fold pyridoxal phosphate-dependent enzyme, partial [Candidatus Berkelbacteria bacterium]|nr:aminotransferase class III-fold pyridoxal phosphate-dependent enzyme [Candidatus Berkelbacteria bacterium]